MKRASLAEVISELRSGARFVVTAHTNPDGDAVGSMLSMALLLRALGKQDVRCMIADPVPYLYQWLPGADQILNGADRPAPFDTMVIVDVSQRARMGRVADYLTPEVKTVVVDHHLETAPFGDVGYIDPSYAACGEIIVELFEAAGAPLTRAAAECAYVAIATDTGGFRYANTNARSHRIAARLLEAGVDVFEISGRVFDTMRTTKFHLLRRVLDRMQFEAGGSIASSFVTSHDLSDLGAKTQDIDGLINFVRNIEGVMVAILFYEVDANTTKVSLRSRAGFNSAFALEGFGGGGHKGAAGAVIQAPLADAKALVTQHVRTKLEEM